MNRTNTITGNSTIKCSLQQVANENHECGQLANRAMAKIENEAKTEMYEKVELVLIIVAIIVAGCCLGVGIIFCWFKKKITCIRRHKYEHAP